MSGINSGNGNRGPGRRRVVITGLGALTPVGNCVADSWEALKAEKSGIGRLQAFDPSELKVFSAGEVKGFCAEDHFDFQRRKRMDRYAQFAVVAAKEALQDAGLDYRPDRPVYNAGVSFGTALGGVANAEDEHCRFLQDGPKAVNKMLALQVFGGSAHSNIAIEFGLRGVGTTNSNSCASAPIAFGEGLRYIRDGMADVIVAGAAETPLKPLTFGAFAFIRAMSRWNDLEKPELACRPFDLKRDGFVMGEGAGCLILENLEHAKARGAKIYAELSGYFLNNDAFHMTTNLPGGESAIEAMRRCLDDARLTIDDIDHIQAHASATPLNDRTETSSIKKFFGEDRARQIPISGTKGYTSHALGATGAWEAIFSTLSLRDDWLPRTIHCQTPDPECDLDYITEPGGRKAVVNHVLNNSFGFGGINSAIVISRYNG